MAGALLLLSCAGSLLQLSWRSQDLLPHTAGQTRPSVHSAVSLPKLQLTPALLPQPPSPAILTSLQAGSTPDPDPSNPKMPRRQPSPSALSPLQSLPQSFLPRLPTKPSWEPAVQQAQAAAAGPDRPPTPTNVQNAQLGQPVTRTQSASALRPDLLHQVCCTVSKFQPLYVCGKRRPAAAVKKAQLGEVMLAECMHGVHG